MACPPALPRGVFASSRNELLGDSHDVVRHGCAAHGSGGWYGGMPSAEGEEVVLEMDRGAGLQAVT